MAQSKREYMKLMDLLEDGHWGIWKNHPGMLGGSGKKGSNKHPGVPDKWKPSFSKKVKKLRKLNQSGK